ncbi:DeoR family transcriptional regulator [Candidatus Gracilibacteria bacterium]|jgi:heat-inducible transcriptional repressor|nr:DeoR family transcriptional regulator [Candidatus Gracilibacteria bacterium]
MKDRQEQILRAIIQQFTETAQPVGSEAILVSYQFDVSPATIRNDMAFLEKAGLVYQPHTSSGRVPTDLGYRTYIDKLADFEAARQIAHKRLNTIRGEYAYKKAKQLIFDAVNILSKSTNNVSFATMASQRTFYLGISNILKQPEFSTDPGMASQVFEILENDDNFLNLLHSLEFQDKKPQIYIGSENIIEQIKSCSIIVAQYNLGDFQGYIGILGPTRMNYPVNSIILEEVVNLLETNQL